MIWGWRGSTVRWYPRPKRLILTCCLPCSSVCPAVSEGVRKVLGQSEQRYLPRPRCSHNIWAFIAAKLVTTKLHSGWGHLKQFLDKWGNPTTSTSSSSVSLVDLACFFFLFLSEPAFRFFGRSVSISRLAWGITDCCNKVQHFENVVAAFNTTYFQC